MNIKITLITIFCLSNLLILTVLFLEIQEVKKHINNKTLVINKEFSKAVPVYKLPEFSDYNLPEF